MSKVDAIMVAIVIIVTWMLIALGFVVWYGVSSSCS